MTAQALPRTDRIAEIVTTAELLRAGWRKDQIRDYTRRGGLLAVRRGVYAEGAHARKLLSLKGGAELLAIGAASALAGAGADAVVSHQSAACLHKIPLVGRRDLTVHLTRPPGARRHAPEGIRVHTAELAPDHRTDTLGLLVTTAARTVIDLPGRCLSGPGWSPPTPPCISGLPPRTICRRCSPSAPDGAA